MEEERRTEEKNGAEQADSLKGGRVSSTQSSPEAEGMMSHSMNSHPCFLLPIPGYEEDMETVSSSFVGFFLSTTYSHSYDLLSRSVSLPPLSHRLSGGYTTSPVSVRSEWVRSRDHQKQHRRQGCF